MTKEEVNYVFDKADGIKELYEHRHSVKFVAEESGVSEAKVRSVLKLYGFWHGVNRFTEPYKGYMVCPFIFASDLAFLL